MLKKINRIGSKKEFQDVLKTGRMYQSPIFGLLMKNVGDKEKRFGFMVSKKISKRAVDRNKIRRLLADGAKMNLEKVMEGTRGIFLPRKNMLGMKFSEVLKEMEKIIK